MRSRPGKQAIAMHNLHNISQDKYFCPKIMQMSKNHAENELGRIVPNPFIFSFKRTLYEVKASGLHLSFSIFR